MAIIYKTLFEVKLLHEFYMTSQDGRTIFALTNQDDRISFLLDQYARGRESANRDLLFGFHDKTKKEYDGYRIKLVPAYSGFKVAVRVNQVTLNDNSLVYEPFITLPDDLDIKVLFSKRNNSVDSYTNNRISTPLPAAYFFSNEKVVGDRAFPFLTNPVSAPEPGYVYEQGELASFGTNDIRRYYQDGSGDQWEPFAGSAFANENDRLLLPLKFSYSFPGTSNVTAAEFILKNRTGDVIKSVTVSSTARLEKAALDFSGKSDLLNLPETSSFTDFIFSLEVNGNNGYTRIHPVIFSDLFYTTGVWGMASINLKPADPLFHLISNDGYLIKRRDPAGTWTPPPLFEIPVKSRFTYWRYINDRGKRLDLVTDLQDYLFEEEGMLLSKRPRAIARSYFLLQKEGSTDTKYVPNPVNYDVKKDGKQRLCFDIIVPQSALFPVLP